MPPHHCLFDVFDRKLQQYIEADLISYNAQMDWNNPKKYEEYTEPFAILTLGELEAGFVVCLVPLLFSIVVFILEWLATMKDLVVFLFIFKKYFELTEIEGKTRTKLMKNNFEIWHASKSQQKRFN